MDDDDDNYPGKLLHQAALYHNVDLLKVNLQWIKKYWFPLFLSLLFEGSSHWRRNKEYWCDWSLRMYTVAHGLSFCSTSNNRKWYENSRFVTRIHHGSDRSWRRSQRSSGRSLQLSSEFDELKESPSTRLLDAAAYHRRSGQRENLGTPTVSQGRCDDPR